MRGGSVRRYVQRYVATRHFAASEYDGVNQTPNYLAEDIAGNACTYDVMIVAMTHSDGAACKKEHAADAQGNDNNHNEGSSDYSKLNPKGAKVALAPIPNIRGPFSKVCPYLRRGIARVDLKRNKRI